MVDKVPLWPDKWFEETDRGRLIPQELLINLNAVLIVLLVIPVSWAVRKMRTLEAMVIGMAMATAAYAGVKEALRASFNNTLEDQLLLEARIQGRCGKTRDFKEGVIAFMEKRPARYEGR